MNEVLIITVDMKVPEGYVEYCRFFIGDDLHTARQTFEQLKGISDRNIALPLRLSLVNAGSTPHEILGIKNCRLDELAWNVRCITRDIFKYYNFE